MPSQPHATSESLEKHPLKKFFGWGSVLGTLFSGLNMSGLAFLLTGLDFAQAILLGTAFVVVNLSATIWVAKQLVQESARRSLFTWSYPVKFGMNVVILWFLLTQWQIDPIGFLLGLSALLLGFAISLLANYILKR